MTIFLVAYDRQAGQLLQLREFAESERELAYSARHEAEVEFGSKIEVVLLEANSQDDLRMTHARYFGQAELGKLVSTASGGTVVIPQAGDLAREVGEG